MPQVVAIVPALMWLQHRLGQSALEDAGKEEPRPVSERTIQFTPNRDVRSTNLNTNTTNATEYSTDIEAKAGKEGIKI